MTDLKDKCGDVAQDQADKALHAAGYGLENLGQRLRAQDAETVLRDLDRYARKNPLSFLACAAAIGFVATRITPEADIVPTTGEAMVP